MGKTKINEGYAEFIIANHLTNQLEHKPSERAKVKLGWPYLYYMDKGTGKLIPRIYLFVGTPHTANILT